ncbi:hypothetical protein [Kangiella shandongensis]|uniref:hypothetical protein n=1 Tax=Kangiella shandongensis TaxID=2763258 RepID=UPI001CBB3AFE|nr:hypothetical protein [Kangiella shandongensis]
MTIVSLLKKLSVTALTITAITMTTASYADQPTEPLENVKLFGVVNTIDESRQVRHLQPSSSSIKQEHKDGLTILTLSQTFKNNSEAPLEGYYHLPLPNPGALLNYEVTSDQAVVELDDPQQLSLKQGESITYQVRYELNSQLLVGFHQTSELDLEQQLNQNSIAQN